METGDGWIVRARIGCRPVPAAQWTELAELAEVYGNGLVEFTMRGNVQVRGVAEHRTVEAGRRLVVAGLAGVDETSDRRRVVVVNPLARLADATVGGVSTDAVTACLEDLLAQHGAELPPKWWAVVDPDTVWPMSTAGCDVAVRHRGDAWWVIVAGRHVWSGPDPIPELERVAERCARLGCRARDLDGLPGPGGATSDVRVPWWGVRRLEDTLVAAAAPPFGVATAPALHVLALLAASPHVSVHPTPERGVVVIAPHRCADEVDRCLDELDSLGWITAGDDPRRLLSACIGSRGCSAALVDTWQVAAELVGTGARAVERTHVSGCSKRCGAPTAVR
ncbi:MAG: hypothetical protein ACLGHQ_00760, partial [Acidimicrobiia bacterium]